MRRWRAGIALGCALLTACASAPQLPEQGGRPETEFVSVKGVYTVYHGKSYRPSAIAELYSRAGAHEAARLARDAQVTYDSGKRVDGTDIAWAAFFTVVIIAIAFAVSAGGGSPNGLEQLFGSPGWGPPSKKELDHRERAARLVERAADSYNAKLALKPSERP